MKMELIQPFINAGDAVLSETLKCSTQIGDVNMDEEVYRRKGMAALITIQGDIEGRVILDLDTKTAAAIATALMGSPVAETDSAVQETIFELSNLIIGNAVTTLNDQGFRFKIHPPELHTAEHGINGSEDTEALVMCLDTPAGSVYMNIAMRYNRRRKTERESVVRA
ncbi:MAG: CheC-like protein [Candidatus Angelobacter sp.]|jgi:CheY-specific phosphatase CheX|nr:CheC-like protein [Acidobacteriaceae bacterium]MCU1310272.1 CheC-like protein [Candidatus Angelobacter sp.]